MVPLLFTKDMRFKFVEMVQTYEDTLNPSASTTSPLALCFETDKSETAEMTSFTAKLESAACPASETKRLNFWLSSIRKLSQQMRQLSLYSEEKKTNAKPSFYENPQRSTQNKQGGASLKISCVVCPNKHMSAKGKPTQYLGHCEFFKNQSLSKQKELCKSNKICFVCLAPMSGCRKDQDFKTCTKQSQWNLKCRVCGDLRHHTIMCAAKPSSTYQSEPQHGSQRSGVRGNSNRGRGGGRGGRGGRGRGGQRQNGDRRPQGNSNQSFQSSHSQASNPTCPGQSSTTSTQSASCSNLEKHCNQKPLHNANETQQNSKLGQVQPQKQITLCPNLMKMP